MENDVISGQHSKWNLVKKLGEGDAGEVYLVKSLLGDQLGVLKRPQRNAFAGEIIRQATQIKNEGVILKALSGIDESDSGKLHNPKLLDQSLPGTEFTDRLFIVIEKANGFDLNTLRRACTIGLSGDDDILPELSILEASFINTVSENGEIPVRILLACLLYLVNTLEWIHTKSIDIEGIRAEGIIYNDIKPEHIFWDPSQDVATLIDWGNAQFIENDGMSRDRRYSVFTDNLQYFEEMGKYLDTIAPDLRLRLGWPAIFEIVESNLYQAGGLRERIQKEINKENDHLLEYKKQEQICLDPANASMEKFTLLGNIHKEIRKLGAFPDYQGALRLTAGYATQLVITDQVEMLQELCDWAVQVPGANQHQWLVISRLVEITRRSQGDMRTYLLDALQAAICMDGQEALWQLSTAVQDSPLPNWWYEVVNEIRHMQVGSEADALLPLVAVNRLALSLQSTVRQMEDIQDGRKYQDSAGAGITNQTQYDYLVEFLHSLQQYEISPWSLVDPPPPHALLSYDSLCNLLNGLGSEFQREKQVIENALLQPQAQVNRLLDAWEHKEFLNVSHYLRHLLIWDPDRRRVLGADQIIKNAPIWLKRIHLGPAEGENFQEFVTDLEFAGRELRNHVGPASWLNEILDSLSRLRKGVWPADLLAEVPHLYREIPWLKGFERVERLPEEVKMMSGENVDSKDAIREDSSVTLSPSESPLPKQSYSSRPEPIVHRINDIQKGVFGPGGDLYLVEPLDAWAPEARGSSARVYLGECTDVGGTRYQAAIKLMRMDKVDYALPLFREEVQILNLMDNVPGVSRMLECGFIFMNREGTLPEDREITQIQNLSGEMLRIGHHDWPQFIERLDKAVEDGWTPYLAIEKRKNEDNLLYICDSGLTHGQYQPLIHLLQMSVQICDILQAAHDRNIVYRDHKILHYYWQKQTNGVYFIDWNVARVHPEGLTEIDKTMDLVQFGARGLHYILTGRAAPGALPLGPTRPDEIEQSAQSYKPQWTYDDQRLPVALREIVERLLAGEYSNAITLRDDLKKSYMQLPYISI